MERIFGGTVPLTWEFFFVSFRKMTDFRKSLKKFLQKGVNEKFV
jgi:hypothetical protein